jgi:putative transcriptional regulator
MSAFDSIKRGFEEAKDFSAGERTDSAVLKISLAEINVSEIRAQTGLSQAEFARKIGVAKGTLQTWENRRRTPTGPAKVLLALIARKPSVFEELL